jgi:superfamily II DNA or RNA helicase
MIKIKETATRLILSGENSTLNMLSDHFKYRPDSYWRAISYQLWVSSKGRRGWDGYIRPLSVRDARGEVLRGRLEELLSICELLDLQYNADGLLPRPFEHMQTDDLPSDLIEAAFELDEHQRACVVAWLRYVMCMCQITVSGGKTAISASAASFVKRTYPKARFIYLCPTERLVNQVYKEMRKFLPDWDITQFGGGKSDSSGADMVCATDAMLRTHFIRLDADGFFKSFMGILNDECHRSLSATREKVLLATPAFFRFACSDTNKYGTKGGMADMKGLCGPIVHSVEAAPLIESDRIARPNIYIVDVPEWEGRFKSSKHSADENSTAWALVEGNWEKGRYLGPLYKTDENGKMVYLLLKGAYRDEEGRLYKDEEGKPLTCYRLLRDTQGEALPIYKLNSEGNPIPIQITGYHRIEVGGVVQSVESSWCLLDRLHDKGLIRFKERNELIRQWTAYYAQEKGWQTLVICTRTLHVMALNKLISDTLGDERVRILLGSDSTKKRDLTFEWFRDTPGSVLISPLVKEGVSLPFIKGGVVADHVVDNELFRQYIGRFIRKKPGKDNQAHVTMFLDRQHPRLKKNSLALLEAMQDVRGFRYYYPVTTPETISAAECFEALN